MLTYRTGAAGAPSAALAMAKHLLEHTLPAEQMKVAEYYAQGQGVDEALAGAARHVEVTLHPDDSVEVHDDGRGIPTDKEPRTGLPGRLRATVRFTAASESARRR